MKRRTSGIRTINWAVVKPGSCSSTASLSAKPLKPLRFSVVSAIFAARESEGGIDGGDEGRRR